MTPIEKMQHSLERELIDSLKIVANIADTVAISKKERAAIVMVDEFIRRLEEQYNS